MGIKEQVKSGHLTSQEAMAKVSKDSHTYGWCKRRGNKTVVVPVAEAVAAEPEKAKSKYKQKHYQKPKKS